MAIERKTVIDQIEVRRDGTIGIRMAKLLVEDGKELSCQWHRTSVPPGTDPAAQLEVVNTHLASMGERPVDSTDKLLDVVSNVVGLVHTPEVIQAHLEAQAVAKD